eukprot:7331112-Lingulodinium_polyedra.AAC.1
MLTPIQTQVRPVEEKRWTYRQLLRCLARSSWNASFGRTGPQRRRGVGPRAKGPGTFAGSTSVSHVKKE